MPLTGFQHEVLSLLAAARTTDGYVAGGAALHTHERSVRISRALDFFHDALEEVGAAFDEDRAVLIEAGYSLQVLMSQPGYVRALVGREGRRTQIDWAHDSGWRFLPTVRTPDGFPVLHDVDLAVNKTLTLAGRDEPRDFVDMLYAHERILVLGALVWAAVAKDPGFTPFSLLAQLKRRGRHRHEEIERLDLTQPFDLAGAKSIWLAALSDAETFVRSRPADEVGCLYYSPSQDRFLAPLPDTPLEDQGLVTHFAQTGGVLPQPAGLEIERSR
ncbi:hypothetical protein [Candidatus Palauibacter sp.]|uniref:hypothetical protein n=1 Tax=Candidatus Palauibacter sp. TaxID=3101350 RepID=UPI003B5B17EC